MPKPSPQTPDAYIMAKVGHQLQQLFSENKMGQQIPLDVDEDPFTLVIRLEQILCNFKQLDLDQYKGVTDPTDHVVHVSTNSRLYAYSDSTKYKFFATTL
ncbi:hypothetical protein ACH5RR_032661 [Cinchona calisaya]|uniref:Uncharacterized protein n=1 Tax=Cinchona calisaya TaxID=153742 RepID=A0ABD2YMX4_9GENT